jgi:nitrate reductase gamma subunit
VAKDSGLSGGHVRKIHGTVSTLAWLLFAAWPFTRLVHVFSPPLGYLSPA